MVELKLYERPGLATDVKPGQILEALPQTEATQTYLFSEPLTEFPTNVFGVVRGILKRDYYEDKIQGDTLVERVVPFGGKHLDTVNAKNNALRIWTPEDRGIYFVVGELTDIAPTGYKDVFSQNLTRGSVTLSPEQVDIVRDALLQFMSTRARKDYVFQSPEGNTYSLNDILFSLREKK